MFKEIQLQKQTLMKQNVDIVFKQMNTCKLLVLKDMGFMLLVTFQDILNQILVVQHHKSLKLRNKQHTQQRQIFLQTSMVEANINMKVNTKEQWFQLVQLGELPKSVACV